MNKSNSHFDNNFHCGIQSLFNFRTLLIGFCMSLILVACGGDDKNESSKNEASTPVTEATLVLNADNIDKLSKQLAKDYFELIDDLLTSYKKYKKDEDGLAFSQYRNFHWTPAYMEKKNYYSAIYEQNKTVIEQSGLTPLFLNFENLIFHGINLKRSLLDNDQKLLTETMTQLKKDKATVSTVVKAAKQQATSPAPPVNIISN